MRRILVSLTLVVLLSLTVVPVAAKTGLTCDGIHVVQPGENLYRISLRYGVSMWTLAQVNGIANTNHIYVGQRLVIPGAGTCPTPVPAPGGVHIVQRGETLSLIAQRYGVSTWAVAQANNLYNTNLLYVGQRLVIPGLIPPTPPVPLPQPVPGPTTTAWRGEYFKGKDPTGGPVFTQDTKEINFDWGLSSPDKRLCCDAFSVRWSKTINFKGGVYRFTVAADDGVRVWVNSNLIIDEWRIQPETTFEVDVTLPAGKFPVTVEYFEEIDFAKIQFSFKRLGDAPEPPDHEPKPDEDGLWLGLYYPNANLEGPPRITRLEPWIDFEWHGGAPDAGLPAESFSARWTRNVNFAAGAYRFCLMADDGARVWIDSKLVIDEWHASSGETATCQEQTLTAGAHIVYVEYYEGAGNALVKLWWEKQ
ncbi:MAG: LysM peptidoglycan-binding domain-containing protein [Anaerolineae bacterium]|nr:LysM peptidoglycan-binding domain-containing protein [Anaerolineae bacterium]